MASTRIASFVATTVLGLTAPLSGQVAPPSADPALPARPAAAERFNLGLRGVYFVENQGQWSDASVHYGLKSRGLDVAFRESSFTMHLARPIDDATNASRGRGSAPPRIDALDDDFRHEQIRGVEDSAPAYEHLTLTVSFPGSNPVTPRGAQPQTAKFNYYVGGEGRGIASNVPSFGAVIYENLYDGIDLHVTGNDDGVMKYEFHCAPGADYAQIRIHYDGIDSLCVNDKGDLEIATSFGTLRDGAPIVWQEGSASRGTGSAPPRIADTSNDESPSRAPEEAAFTPSPGSVGEGRGGGDPTSRTRKEAEFDAVRDAPLADTLGSSGVMRTTILARFEVIDATTYRIALDTAPDPLLPLVIDPEIEWMYYLGGSAYDYGYGIAVDDTGNALVTGYATSTDFAGRNNSHYGGDDAFALKISPSGQLQWMTYLGGSGGDYGRGIAVDAAGDALVIGETTSTNFDGRNNSYHGGYDAFALKVSPSGQIQWMTYLGASGSDYGRGIAVDATGNALVTGRTESTDFAGRNNSYYGDGDAFALRVSPSGQIQWMTYLGGSGDEAGGAIAVDSTGNALVAGVTTSTDFAGRNNSYYGGTRDAFALKVSPSGQIQWMTYLGGSGWDSGAAIDVDGAGDALVTGVTYSANFAGRNNSFGGNNDAFALKVSRAGQIQWMTYLGGSGYDYGFAMAVDGAGDSLVTGETTSTDFAERNNSHHGGIQDAFALKVSTSGQLQWMTYLGGSGDESGKGIAVDDSGNTLVAGFTSSTNFEGRNNSYHGGTGDAFLLKLRLADGPQLAVAATCPSGGSIQIEWSGASPGGQVALIFARNTGSFIIPNNRPCAGTQLGLGSNQIQIVYNGHAGVNGSRTLNTTAGPGACGGYLQLLDLPTCGTSNVARVE